jgi:CRP-like cAMP-binding protein
MRKITIEEFEQTMAPQELSSGSIFGAVSVGATRFLLEHGKIYKVMVGESVYEYGDRGDRFYVVCEGSIDFLKYYKGELHPTRTASFGQEVGFVAMIDLHEEGGSAIASQESVVLQISAELFSELQQSYPLDFGLMTLNLARDMARLISVLGEALIEQRNPVPN